MCLREENIPGQRVTYSNYKDRSEKVICGGGLRELEFHGGE